MNLSSWLHELQYESDIALRSYLYFGVKDSFLIVDTDATVPSYDCPNYITLSSGDSYAFVAKLIGTELQEGKYVYASVKPHCIHATGAVSKAEGKFKPITDCKRPLGDSINNFMTQTCNTFSYKSADDVSDYLYRGCYMATVDISSAYRSISIHPSQWTYQGVRWNIQGLPTLLFDTRVCFGVKNPPYLFTQVSNCVTRCMNRRWFFRIINYLDDFMVIGDSFESCQHAQIGLLISLGFEVSWKRCTSP